jgi:hypothetical protein
MPNANPRPSIARRVGRMAMTWLLLGASIGAAGATGQGGPIEVFAMMIGGMAVYPIVGVFLGLIGGDARGSVVGAAGGFLGGRLADVLSTTVPPSVLSMIAVCGALVGATGFLFLRFLIWKYRTIFRTVWWLIGMTPMSGKASALAIHVVSHRLVGVAVHDWAPSIASRFSPDGLFGNRSRARSRGESSPRHTSSSTCPSGCRIIRPHDRLVCPDGNGSARISSTS